MGVRDWQDPAGTGVDDSRRDVVPLISGAAVALAAPVLLAVQAALSPLTIAAAVAAAVVCAAACTVLVVAVARRMASLHRHLAAQQRRLRELARTDDLTGLPNRLAWDDELPRALERARRDGTPVTVAVLDLDHFTIYNDCYGLAAGDRLLTAAAASWRAELRAVDLLVRYGGEEFAILLAGADSAGAVTVLERLQYATPLSQKVSVGLATWDGVESSGELTARADAALAAAKAAGRDRITPAAAAPVAAAPAAAAPVTDVASAADAVPSPGVCSPDTPPPASGSPAAVAA